MPVGTTWEAKGEYGWFKTQVTITAEAQGKRVVIELYPTDQEGQVGVNGRAASSFGWGHRVVPLTHDAKPRTNDEILIESYAGH